jgi:hypothetical protein
MANKDLTKAKIGKNDEFYTQYHDIENENPIARIYNPCPQTNIKGFSSVFLRYLFDRALVK